MRPTRVEIDHAALRHNLARLRQLAPQSQIWPAIKANAYGHGLLRVAKTLAFAQVDGFAVACVEEAMALRQAYFDQRILLLEGPMDADDLFTAYLHNLDCAVTTPEQVHLICQVGLIPPRPQTVWLKLDSGMHRLGLMPNEFREAFVQLQQSPQVTAVNLMTHFACADLPDHPLNAQQWETFQAVTADLPGKRSLANSATILRRPTAHGDLLRPGLMIYGMSPFAEDTAADWGLRPVMTFKTALIAVKTVPKGETVGYGATFVCPETMPIGIAAVGYGDGYPRHVPSGTPILVNGQRAALAGRVSMDLIAVDLRGLTAAVGDEVVLWGNGLPVEIIARAAQTIPYTLTTGITGRVRADHR